MWKFKSWSGKDKWLFVLTLGVILCILAFPVGKSKTGNGAKSPDSSRNGQAAQNLLGEVPDSLASSTDLPSTEFLAGASADAAWAASGAVSTYEQQLEKRVKEILKHVDGVGEVEVMIVLKSTSEKVIHVDGSSSRSLTEETDSAGGSRRAESVEQEHNTVFSSADGGSSPLIEKELYPELSGIIISAAGGGSPRVQEEISAAMEALFGLPAHKIKVLKRVE